MPEIEILDKTFVPYISEEQINTRVTELAAQIDKDLNNKNPLFMGVLNGCFIFASDLYKNISIPSEISFVKMASYQGTKSTGAVSTLIGLDVQISDRHIVVIEDIIDTGNTLKEFMSMLQEKKPASISVVTLLDKPSAREHDIEINYAGFEIENKFVVGYGLDYDGYGRNTKEIYQLK